MPKVKVKTLNDGDQSIDFEDHMTVLDLKESISERLNISPDHQRLIYCGRILQNDKKLEEYDLDNKVIHLVDSPPNLDAPNQSQNRRSSTNQSPNGSSSDSNQETTIPSSHFSININLNGANVHSNAQSRVATLTRILDYINLAIDKLEQDPNLSSPSFEQTFEENLGETINTSSSTRTNLSGSNLLGNDAMITDQIAEIDIFPIGDPLSGGQSSQNFGSNFLDQLDQNIQESLSSFNSGDAQGSSVVINLSQMGDSNSGLSANNSTTNATATTNQNANSNSTASNQPASQASIIGNLLGNITRGIISHTLNQPNFQTIGNPFTNTPQSSLANNQEQATQTNSTTDTNQTRTNQHQSNARPANRNHRVTWTEYAELLESVKRTQERFQPHLNSFQQSLLQRHGSLSVEEAEGEQAKYRLIARCMHHLAHVYHLLSDFHVNYVHQQDQTIQVFEPLNVPVRRPPAEIRMTNGSIILGSATAMPLTNLNSTNASNTTNSASTQRPTTGARTTNASSLPNSFMFSTATNQPTSESPNNSHNLTRPNQSSSFFVLPNPSSQQAQNNNQSSSSNSSFEQSLLQNLIGSLPNLSSSNVVINAQPRTENQSSTNNLPSSNSATIRIIETFDRIISSNSQPPNQPDNNPPPQSAAGLRNLFSSFGTGGTTTTSSSTARPSTQNPSNTNTTNNQTTNSSSNANVISMVSTGSNFRMPPTNNHVYNHVRNFDPHLPCTSNWLIPEMRGRLQVEMTMDPSPEFLSPVFVMSNTRNSAANTSLLNQTTGTSSALSESGARSSQALTEPSSLNADAVELFNELKSMFSSYLGQEELLRRIDRLPVSANNSLSSFIDSMNILNLISKNKSNITIELFMILAKKISVVEFLKIIFRPFDLSNFKCLNRAQESMVNYARTNLLFSTEEPFDTSSYVDDLLKMWKKVLLISFKELEFSERTFSALMSELRANLSVFLRSFTRTFDNNTENSFASTIYSAIQRIFLDFHTSLSQMLERSPDNVMRAYRNILIHMFPNSDVRSIVIAILSYRIPAIDETEISTLEFTRFNERVLKLTDQTDAAGTTTANKRSVHFAMENQASASNSSTSASSSDYQTPMDIDPDEYNISFASERWHLNVPRNWIKPLTKDRDKIDQNRSNVPINRLRFSSLYGQAYKRN